MEECKEDYKQQVNYHLEAIHDIVRTLDVKIATLDQKRKELEEIET